MFVDSNCASGLCQLNNFNGIDCSWTFRVGLSGLIFSASASFEFVVFIAIRQNFKMIYAHIFMSGYFCVFMQVWLIITTRVVYSASVIIRVSSSVGHHCRT